MYTPSLAESSKTDFKAAVEHTKPKSWLKTVSAFANTIGGTIVFGITDDFKVKGLENIQADSEFISEQIKTKLSPVPNFELKPETTKDNYLTNGGILFADQCPILQSRIFCTRWNGLDKTSIFDDAVDDKEYSGNLIYLLNSGLDFIKNNTKFRWRKTATSRISKPDYPERAVYEALVNAIVHRNYGVVGSEIHIDIYDDRLTITSPGGMFDGSIIQEQDYLSVTSSRRNPVIADIFFRLKFMERRGSGLRKIIDAYKGCYEYTPDYAPLFDSTQAFFFTTLKNLNYEAENVPQDVQEEESSVKTREKTREKILRLVIENPKITYDELSRELNLTEKGIEYAVRKLRNEGTLKRIGPDNGGYWEVIDKE